MAFPSVSQRANQSLEFFSRSTTSIVQQFFILAALLIHVFCVHLRTNSDLCHLQHKLIGFYNRDEKCLERGTDWGFKYSGLRLGFKGLKCT